MNTKKLMSIIALFLGLATLAIGIVVICDGRDTLRAEDKIFEGDFYTSAYGGIAKSVNSLGKMITLFAFSSGWLLVVVGAILVGNALIVLLPEIKIEAGKKATGNRPIKLKPKNK